MTFNAGHYLSIRMPSTRHNWMTVSEENEHTNKCIVNYRKPSNLKNKLYNDIYCINMALILYANGDVMNNIIKSYRLSSQKKMTTSMDDKRNSTVQNTL